MTANPTIDQLKSAGFDDIYFDPTSWDELNHVAQAQFTQSCVRLLDEETDLGGTFFLPAVEYIRPRYRALI